MKLLHVVQHTSAEYLGLIEDHLEGRGVRFKYYRPFAGKTPLPHRDTMRDGLILLGGGPWGAAGRQPWNRQMKPAKQYMPVGHSSPLWQSSQQSFTKSPVTS